MIDIDRYIDRYIKFKKQNNRQDGSICMTPVSGEKQHKKSRENTVRGEYSAERWWMEGALQS